MAESAAAAVQKQVDLAFAMDCTGSMSSYIHQAQENVRKIAEDIVCQEKVDLRMALIQYRDHPPEDKTFVTNVLDFTERLKEMKSKLDECTAAGGGDTPEAVADALHALLKLSWRQTAVKVCVFIADAPPHGLGCHGDAFSNGCPCGLDPMATARELAEKEIAVYTVGCEPSINEYREWFMAISHITSGQYVPLASAKLLSQAIIGGTIEEIALNSLMPAVEAEVMEFVAAAGGEVDQDKLEQQVFNKFKNAKTKSIQSDTGALRRPSERAVEYAQLGSMMEVRAAYVPDRLEQHHDVPETSAYLTLDSEFSVCQSSRVVRKCLAKNKMSYK